MRTLLTSTLLAVSLAAGTALAQDTGYSVKDTEVGTLMDDPAAAAVLEKHMPGFTTADNISAARPFTLASLQMFAPAITDKILAEIDQDLKKLPPKKTDQDPKNLPPKK